MLQALYLHETIARFATSRVSVHFNSVPRAIAIETSSRIGSVAIVEDAVVRAEDNFEHGLANAAQLLPKIDALVRSRNWTPRDVEHLYVSAGPGSFTGLRIGITLAKTLALVTGAKIVAVPSVRVLVENAPADAKHVIIVLDAKRGQIFTARFEREDDTWVDRVGARLDTLANMLAGSPRTVHLLGEGIPYHVSKDASLDGKIVVTDDSIWRPRAAAVAKLGSTLAAKGEFADAMTLTPIYIRRPEAEEVYERRHAQNAAK